MTNKNTTELTINFPIEEYEYLELAAKKMSLSINQFIALAIVTTIHNLEDELYVRKKEGEEYTPPSWKELCFEMGKDAEDSFLNLK